MHSSKKENKNALTPKKYWRKVLGYESVVLVKHQGQKRWLERGCKSFIFFYFSLVDEVWHKKKSTTTFKKHYLQQIKTIISSLYLNQKKKIIKVRILFWSLLYFASMYSELKQQDMQKHNTIYTYYLHIKRMKAEGKTEWLFLFALHHLAMTR